jgi:DNA-binding Lrp family transcriptional regulator
VEAKLEHYHPKDEMKRFVRAFIYMSTKLGKEKSVAEALWKIPEVKEVHIVPGKYDVLAVAEVERKFLEPDSHNIYWFLNSRIENIDDILDTQTLMPIVSMSRWSH